jgi:hypothetical protein
MQNASYAEEIEAEAPSRARHAILLEDIGSPVVQKGLGLWRERANGKTMPSRADLSPRVLSGLLRNTGLIRVVGDNEFEMRIVGDALVTAQGASFQGMTTAEIDLILPGYGAALNSVYRYVRRTAQPAAYRGWYVREADGHSVYHESVVLPLSDDGQMVDHLLVVGAYAKQPGGVLR